MLTVSSWYMPSLRRHSATTLCDGALMASFCVIFASCISASRVQHISLLHSKFAVTSHHVWKYGRWRIFCHFLRPVFSVSRVQHISDLHSKFALRSHHVWKYGRHPICDLWEQARKKEERKKKGETTEINIMSTSATLGVHKKKIETTAAKYYGLPYWAAIRREV